MTSRKSTKTKIQTLKFDKYDLYVNSVQSAEHDARLIWKMYLDATPKAAKRKLLLREDFCGTAGLCFEWAKLGANHHAVGVDIDNTALTWGLLHHGTNDQSSQHKNQIKLVCNDVMKVGQGQPDIICALNFSYYFMNRRSELKRYFELCRQRLANNGMLILDAFGGPEYLVPHRDKRRNDEKKFNFWWEIESFDAISHRVKTHIDFQVDGQKIRKRVFSYDWRLWTLPEIVDVLCDAGFKKIEFWAEGLDASGHGNGRFRKIKTEKNCATWVTYITAKS
jgi:SAM-dependent methyltransferase